MKESLKRAYSRHHITLELIQSMLEINPSKRPTVLDILEKSPFFLFNAVIYIFTVNNAIFYLFDVKFD